MRSYRKPSSRRARVSVLTEIGSIDARPERLADDRDMFVSLRGSCGTTLGGMTPAEARALAESLLDVADRVETINADAAAVAAVGAAVCRGLHDIAFPEIVHYRPDLTIRNIEQLPRGSGAPYLECVHGERGELVAKRWRHKPIGAVVVKF